MCLREILKRMEQGQYRIGGMVDDLYLIVKNALQFNSPVEETYEFSKMICNLARSFKSKLDDKVRLRVRVR